MRARGEASTTVENDERFGAPTPDGFGQPPTPPASVPSNAEVSSNADVPAHAEVLSSDGLVLAAPSILADGGAPLPEKRSRKRPIAMVAAAALVLGVGAGAYAVGAALSGGGAQPESVVPAGAVFYAEVDLDPSAGQKVDAFRFLRKFPALKDAFTADGGFGPGFAKLFDDTDVDYAKDIEPWLGKRYAVALVPGPTKDALRAEAVIQVTDEKAALASLTHLMGSSGLKGTTVVVRDGYAIIAVAVEPESLMQGDAPTGAADTISAEAQAASLESSAAYTSAIQPYGSGVVTVWSDNAGFAKLTSGLTSSLGAMVPGLTSTATDAKGYSVAVLKFDGDTLELDGARSGATTKLPTGDVSALLTLPDSTLAAFGGSGLGPVMEDAIAPYLDALGSFATMGGALAGSEDPFGSPKTWPTLFGDQTVVALGGGDASAPDVGVHVVGGPKTVAAVLKVVQAAGGAVSVQKVDDGVVVATSDDWLAALAGQGTFGSNPQFQDAVPDAAHASVVGYVDIKAMVDQFGGDLSADDRAALAPLTALGVSATTNGDTVTYTVRLLTS